VSLNHVAYSEPFIAILARQDLRQGHHFDDNTETECGKFEEIIVVAIFNVAGFDFGGGLDTIEKECVERRVHVKQ
jgi:hypothetical protein